jgi:hypothetical protein
MMRFISIFATVLTLAPAIATAQTAEVKPTTISTPERAKGEGKHDVPLICKTVTPIGSRLGGKRMCHTAQDWAAISSDDRRSVEKMQSNRYNGNE